MKKITHLVVILCVLFCACRKPEIYSDIPEIKFISFEKYQEYLHGNVLECGELTFYFQDGDGDIGLNDTDNYPPFDTASIYHCNFFCDYYEKRNGVFIKIDSVKTPAGISPFNLNARFPRLSKLPEESINGEIRLKMPFYYDIFSPYDTIKLKFHIVDRKLNQSNVEEVVVVVSI